MGDMVSAKYGWLVVGALAGVAIVAATVMAVMGVPIGTIAAIVGFTVGPVLGASMYPLMSELKAGQAAAAATTAQIAVQTNGNTSRMLDMLQDAHRALAAGHIPPAYLPGPAPVPAPDGTGATSPAGPPSSPRTAANDPAGPTGPGGGAGTAEAPTEGARVAVPGVDPGYPLGDAPLAQRVAETFGSVH